ncbi:MAG: DsbA family protein [Beijerinckiaceae bacterium]|nr:DsbA family protein [Beijerinckiaceae bacterium]
MALAIELYWSFRSPYSYIVLPRIISLRESYMVSVDFRIVNPAAIRNPSYFARMDPLARPYFVLDSARAAAFQGLPFRRPVPDPINQDPKTLAIAAEQPLALHLSRLGIAATEEGRGVEFGWEVAKLLWSGEVDGWDRGDHLAEAARRAGLTLSHLQSAVDIHRERFDAQLAENDQALKAAGHWGVPTMVFENEPFFGQDRFDVLVWRLKQRGLARRGASPKSESL